MLCSDNIPIVEVERVSAYLAVLLTKKLGKYLGYHVLSRGRNGDAQMEFVNCVCSRLDGWKMQCLSWAGRIMLCKIY